MNIPNTLIYTREHLWIKSIGDATYEIGITDYAQNLLGDIVFVDHPKYYDKALESKATIILINKKVAFNCILLVANFDA